MVLTQNILSDFSPSTIDGWWNSLLELRIDKKEENENIPKFFVKLSKTFSMHLRSIVVLLFWIELDLEECLILFSITFKPTKLSSLQRIFVAIYKYI